MAHAGHNDRSDCIIENEYLDGMIIYTCGNCNTTVEEKDNYCRKCGTKFRRTIKVRKH
jgi:DNA-directed RNA polymerase subunit RPC12/RpoP